MTIRKHFLLVDSTLRLHGVNFVSEDYISTRILNCSTIAAFSNKDILEIIYNDKNYEENTTYPNNQSLTDLFQIVLHENSHLHDKHFDYISLLNVKKKINFKTYANDKFTLDSKERVIICNIQLAKFKKINIKFEDLIKSLRK